MEWLVNNWYLIVALLCVGAVGGVYVYKFYKLPTNDKIDMLKSYLCELVVKAEDMFASGEGEKKLEYVYNELVKKLPFVPLFIDMATFKMLVNGALYETGIWLKKNNSEKKK